MDLKNIKNYAPHVFLAVFFVYETVCHYGKYCYLTDISREVWFPFSVLNGEVLYKDIFNIFGPFSYYFNALLYKIFGINLSTLYFAGVFNTALILIFTYLIAKKFLPQKISLSIVIFTTICAFYPSIMNYIIPYSYAITYGLSAFLISVYLFLQYLEKDKNIFLCTSALFAGICVTCKYEFFFYPLVMFVFLWMKKHKEHCVLDFLPFASFFVFPLILFSLPFLQGLTIEEFFNYLSLLIKYSKSPSLMYLYSNGNVLLIFAIPILVVIYGINAIISNKLKPANKFTKYSLSAAVLIIYSFLIINLKKGSKIVEIFSTTVPILILLLLIYAAIKKIKLNTSEQFVIFSTIFTILKIFFSYFIIYGYGNYFIGIALISVFILYLKIRNQKPNENNINSINFVFVLMCFVSCIIYLKSYVLTSVEMIENKTANGQYKITDYGVDSVIKYIEHGTHKNDKIIILPEGALINFLTDRKSDNYYNIFTPDRVEAYGQQNIISHYSQNPPEYFVISNYKNKSYGKGSFCEYASDVCIWINQNYYPVYRTFSISEKSTIYLILKRK